MKQSPKNIATEIIRDYRWRFVLEQGELKRLLGDIDRLLPRENELQELRIKYWVGLQNGVIYETESLDIMLNEENAQSLTILLFVIIAELVEKDNVLRRIVVHFSRGKPNQARNRIEATEREWFNLNYRGLSYRVRDTDRESALRVISALEERLNKFRRWYSSFRGLSVSWGAAIDNLVFSLGFAILLYAFSAITRDTRGLFEVPVHAADFVRVAAYGMFVSSSALALALGLCSFINWLLPPSYIAIGDEIQRYERRKKVREGVLWTIVIGGIVGLVVNLITR